VSRARSLVVVHLRGGDAEDAKPAAVCVDLDPGTVTNGTEWLALVRPDRLGELLHNTRAEQIGEPEAWDGRRFGDGAGGTVEREGDGAVRGSGLYAPGLEPPALPDRLAWIVTLVASGEALGTVTAASYHEALGAGIKLAAQSGRKPGKIIVTPKPETIRTRYDVHLTVIVEHPADVDPEDIIESAVGQLLLDVVSEHEECGYSWGADVVLHDLETVDVRRVGREDGE
jgi:hypothetical protein